MLGYKMIKIKNKIRKNVMKEYGIQIGENLLNEIIRDRQRLKMFKKIGYL